MTRPKFRVGHVKEIFLFTTRSRPALSICSASYPMGTVTLSLRVMWPGLRMTTYLHLVPRLRMWGAIPPLPHTSSWCGISAAQWHHYLT